VRDGRKKDELGAVGMEETRADTAALMRCTRVSALQPDHVNEPDFDGKSAEGEDAALATRKPELTRKGNRPQKISQ
jgi:hypothetical protein